MAVFITGDRMESPFYPGFVVMEMLKAAVRGEQLMTGTNDTGVEAAVRRIAEDAGQPVLLVETPFTGEGKPDWDARHAGLAADVRVVVVHMDPMASHIGRSVLSHLPDDRVTLLSPAEMLG